MASKVDELFIKEPGKLEVQCGVMRHLAGQHNALTHSHIEMTGWTGDQSRLCQQGVTYRQSVCPLLKYIYLFQTDQAVCCSYSNILLSAILFYFSGLLKIEK